METIIVRIERWIFHHVGIMLPTLRDKWHRDSIAMQYDLDFRNRR